MTDRLMLTSTAELAKYLGITRQGLYKRTELPPADYHTLAGKPCWLPDTADSWDKAYREQHVAGRPKA